MKLEEFNPALDAGQIADCDVVGVADGMVIHFNISDETVYNSGLTLDDWLNGHAEAWEMTEEEAARVGITDYESYLEHYRACRHSEDTAPAF